MASSTPSAPITSSRGDADTTAGRIYFPTPSAQVRVPVEDLVSPPHLCSHYTTEGKNMRRRRKNLSAGGIIKRERQRKGAVGVREAGRAQVCLKFEKKRKLSHSAENTLFCIFIH